MANKKADFKLNDVKVPRKGTVPPTTENEVSMATVKAMNLAYEMSQSPWGDLPPTQ